MRIFGKKKKELQFDGLEYFEPLVNQQISRMNTA